MVWGRIFASGKTPLSFLDYGVKINKEEYRLQILENGEPPRQQHVADQHWTFRQNSAPAHKSNTTQEWCKAHFLGLITSVEWPPYSPDGQQRLIHFGGQGQDLC